MAHGNSDSSRRPSCRVVDRSRYGIRPSGGHAIRSCLVGVALARELDLDDLEVADTFYTSMLVHVGCVAFSHEMSAAFGDELSANRAGARTNFADPRDIFATSFRSPHVDCRPRHG